MTLLSVTGSDSYSVAPGVSVRLVSGEVALCSVTKV